MAPPVRWLQTRGTIAAHVREKVKGTMAGREEGWMTLATRIPKTLHRKLKLYCVEEGVLVMDFVVVAIEERLRKNGAERKGRKG